MWAACNSAITAAIPGLADADEVKNAAQASCDRKLGMTPRQKQWLARLPAESADTTIGVCQASKNSTRLFCSAEPIRIR